MKNSKPLVILFFFLFGAKLIAQTPNARPTKKTNALDFGIYLGGSNYLGELTKTPLPVMGETHLAGGVMIRYNVGSSLSLRASGMYMRVSGDDKNFDDDDFRAARNLSFRSNIFEFTGGLEWNFLGWQESRSFYAKSPYLFASIGVFRFNPQTLFTYMPSIHDASLAGQDGRWIELQPLSTEGQETTEYNNLKRYSLTQIVIPFGLGYKFQLSDHWCLGLEFGMRKTFTDYLDDISTNYRNDQIILGSGGFMSYSLYDRAPEVGRPRFEEEAARGNPNTKDWYMFGGINITYRILGGRDACPSFK